MIEGGLWSQGSYNTGSTVLSTESARYIFLFSEMIIAIGVIIKLICGDSITRNVEFTLLRHCLAHILGSEPGTNSDNYTQHIRYSDSGHPTHDI